MHTENDKMHNEILDSILLIEFPFIFNVKHFNLPTQKNIYNVEITTTLCLQ